MPTNWWQADEVRESSRFEIDGVPFLANVFALAHPELFSIVKPPAQVAEFRNVLERYLGSNIVELGIAHGGSTAFAALVARPRRLVAIEYDRKPVEMLVDFIHMRGLHESVRVYFGVDQADRERLREIIVAEFEGEPLDLVIDDASHLYQPTVASFEVLFPLLRAGGEYIIEDWRCDHGFAQLIVSALADPNAPMHAWAAARMDDSAADQDPDQKPAGSVAAELLGAGVNNGDRPRSRPLSRLVFELVLAIAERSDAIESLTLKDGWLVVRRGSGALDPTSFRIDQMRTDHFGMLGDRGA